MGTLALRVTGGTKRYPRDGLDGAVFESLDLAVEAGEVFVLLGPSGCGKSTLLRVLAGLEPLSAGRVETNGYGETGQEGGRVGIVFQEPRLLPWLTVSENVGLGLRYRANRAARSPQSVEEILHDFGLTPVAGAYPSELSGGQAQRAGLARTLVTRPTILLLDEPFGALDPRTRATLQDWLLDVVQERRLTAVLVTHDVEEALYLGDRVGLMSSHPGTITHVWETGHRDRPPGEADRRRRDDARLPSIRREILARYQSEVPAGSAPSDWVI